MRAGVHILGILPVALIAVGCGAASSPAPATGAGALEPAATTQAVAQRAPELIPLNHFFASREPTWRHQPSPDGTRLAWLGSHGSRTTVLFRAFGGETVRAIDTHSRRSIGWFIWARDSRRILYAQDQDGDENYHVYLASTERPDDKPVDLTQDPGSRAGISRIPRSDPKHIVVTWNKRDRSVFDLYRVNLDTHDHVLIAENPGDVIEWHTDWNGQPRARIRAVGSSERRLEVLREGRWVEMLRLDLEEFDLRVLGVTADDRALWLLSSHRRDRRALVRLDLATAAETVVYEHVSLDVEWVEMSERSRAPLAVFTTPGRQTVHFLDPDLGGDLTRLARRDTPTGLYIRGFDDEERLVTVQVFDEKGYETWLLDRRTGERTLLAGSHLAPFATALATTEPVSFTVRDGVRLHGYLTRPPGFTPPGPLVLHVHGGHWARDYWSYDRIVQFFANRGYAVLQVNYRGSTGYGRRFRELAVGEYAGKMHDDLVDAVRWAVGQGVVDPARVAIHGGSYGGYAALVGMTFTPDVFACGVAVVPISNLVSFHETVPPYWKHAVMPLWHKYVGDPNRPEDRRRLEEKSPLFRADRVQRPVLLIHGARDVRVNVRESEQMAEALRKNGKDVRLLVFPDEGHQRDYGNWRNALRHYREIEDFLAPCLGGRRSGGASRLDPLRPLVKRDASEGPPGSAVARSGRRLP
jgi:dipeptidyl aminopeptidase/acylaminoacyl peptidase